MDMNEILDGSSSDSSEYNLVITGEIREFLKVTAKWAKFLAIVSFVFMGLGALMMLFGLGSGGGAITMLFSSMGGFGAIGILLYLIIIGISFMLMLYMYKFATNTQQALRADDQEALRMAFANLKSYFKLMGVLMAIMIAFYVIIFLFALLAGVGAAF